MQAAAAHGLRFFVLDRPDPIAAAVAQGPLLSPGLLSFTGFIPLPLRPGMTVGEMAGLFNAQARIGARLTVIRMQGYHRGEWLDETALPRVPPSPNLRSLEEEILYPGVGMVEGANVSVGRGTDTPFQILGAPWIDGPALARCLAQRNLPGVRCAPVSFTPAASRFQGRLCHGVRILLANRRSLRSGLLGVELISALHRLYPRHSGSRKPSHWSARAQPWPRSKRAMIPVRSPASGSLRSDRSWRCAAGISSIHPVTKPEDSG